MSELSVYLPKNKIKEGMTIAVDFYDKSGNMLISAGTVLNEFHIKKIYDFDSIFEIAIVDRRNRSNNGIQNSAVELNSVRMKMFRKKTMAKVKTTIKNFGDSRNQGMNALFDVVEKIIEEILDSDVLLYEIDRMQSADDYLYSHVINTTIVSLLVGISMGFHKAELKSLALGAFFCDSGKLQIDPEIIKKPSALTEEEYKEVRNYPEYGYQFMSSYEEMDEASLRCIWEVREHWDGSGYPRRLKGDEISLYAQIVGFSTFFDAVVSERTYKKAISPYEAMSIAVKEAGSTFNPEVVKKACQMLGYFNEGMLVRLKTGEIAKVIKTGRHKPVLAIIYDPNVYSATRVFEIDMRKNPAVKIAEVIVPQEHKKIVSKINGTKK